jgi:DNA-binding NarL/FixJ family response regulator
MRVIVAEDEPLYREMLVKTLAANGFDVAEAASADELIALSQHLPVDLILADIKMPPGMRDDGLRAAIRIRKLRPQTSVVILSKYAETEYALQLLEAFPRHPGHVGYVRKDRILGTRALLATIERVLEGDSVIDPEVVGRLIRRQHIDNPLTKLSDRERETLRLMAEGYNNSAIADQLHVSAASVDRYMTATLIKLGLDLEQGKRTVNHNARVLAILTYLRHMGMLLDMPTNDD